MLTIDTNVQALNKELVEIRHANLTINDRFIAEAALISRELLLDLMSKHSCTLEAITPALLIGELQLRAPMTYSVPAIPETTSCP